jgi:hypothetical protein
MPGCAGRCGRAPRQRPRTDARAASHGCGRRRRPSRMRRAPTPRRRAPCIAASQSAGTSARAVRPPRAVHPPHALPESHCLWRGHQHGVRGMTRNDAGRRRWQVMLIALGARARRSREDKLVARARRVWEATLRGVAKIYRRDEARETGLEGGSEHPASRGGSSAHPGLWWSIRIHALVERARLTSASAGVQHFDLGCTSGVYPLVQG